MHTIIFNRTNKRKEPSYFYHAIASLKTTLSNQYAFTARAITMKIILRKFLLFLVITQTFGVNILYLNDVLSPSHHLWNRVLAMKLASIGYNVTFLTLEKPKVEMENLHYLVIEGAFQAFYEVENFNLLAEAKINTENKIKSASSMMVDFVTKGCRAVMKGKHGIEKILSYPDNFKFDIVVNDFSAGPCLLPLIHKFKYPPVVGVSPFLIPSYTTYSIGGHKYPAYVPLYIIDLPQIMNFYQRFYNHLLYWIEKL